MGKVLGALLLNPSFATNPDLAPRSLSSMAPRLGIVQTTKTRVGNNIEVHMVKRLVSLGLEIRSKACSPRAGDKNEVNMVLGHTSLRLATTTRST